MDRVEAYMQIDEASRKADILSRRLSDASNAIAYGNVTVNWQMIQSLLDEIQGAVDRVQKRKAGQ